MAIRNDILIQIRGDLSDLNAKLDALVGVSRSAADGVTGTWDGVTGQFARLGLAIDGAKQAFEAILAPIRAVVDTAADFQSLQTRLTGLYGSVEAGSRAFERFNQVASSTPFSLKQVVEAGAQLKAFGADAESLIVTISDLAAFMGTDIVEASAAFGRAFAGGAGAADILRERGVLQLVKSFSGIEDLTKATLPEFRAALISTLQDPAANIAGSSDRLSKTFSGAVSNMQDSLDRLKATLGDSLLPTLSGAISGLGELFAGIEANLGTIGRVIGLTVSAFVGLGVAVVASRLAMLNLTNSTILLSFALGRARDAAITASAALGLSPIGVALGLVTALGAALAVLVDPFDAVEEAASGTSTAVDNLNASLEGVVLSDFWGRADVYAANLGKLADEAERLKEATADMASGVVEAGKASQDAFAGLGDTFQPTADALQFLAQAVENTTAQAKKAQAEVSALTAEEAAKAVKAAQDREKRLSDIRRDGIDREIRERDAAYSRIAQMREDHDLLMGRLELERRQESAAVDAEILQRNADFVAQAIANTEASWAEYTSQVQNVQAVATAAFDALGQGMQAVFEGQQGALRNVLKGSLLIVLDYMKQIVQAANLKALADAILLFNPGQIAKNFALAAAIEALFAGLRSGITAFQEGGLVTSPTLALIGENARRSGAELVVPEKRFMEWAREALPKIAGSGPDGVSQKLLAGVNDRLDKMDATLARLAPAIGREAGLAAAGALRGRF